MVKIRDYKSLEETDLLTGEKTPIEQDSSNVLQWITADGSIVSVRPSGTEPKIKFYFGVKMPLASVDRTRRRCRRSTRRSRLSRRI